MSIGPRTCLTFGPHPPPDSPLRCDKCRTDRHLTIRSIAELRPPANALVHLEPSVVNQRAGRKSRSERNLQQSNVLTGPVDAGPCPPSSSLLPLGKQFRAVSSGVSVYG
jgi:hypothetical protein